MSLFSEEIIEDLCSKHSPSSRFNNPFVTCSQFIAAHLRRIRQNTEHPIRASSIDNTGILKERREKVNNNW